MVKSYKLALIGFGTVGSGFLELLNEKTDTLKEKYGLKTKLVAIADKYFGSVYDPNGLDIEKLLRIQEKGEGKGLEKVEAEKTGLGSVETIELTNANVIVEATWTNVETGEPGLTHVKTALKNGKHVIMSNKGPCAVAYNELKDIAKKNESFMRYEGTVMAGTPVLKFIREDLAGCEIQSVRGIVNGTTNYILTKMEEKGWSFDEALKRAQELGYAEDDPSADIDGWDAAAKVSILSNVVFNTSITPQEVERTGIRDIKLEDIENLEDKKMKLIAEVEESSGKIRASVEPRTIPLSNALSGISGATNALLIATDHLGKVMVTGPGAGKRETGQAILTDLINIHEFKARGKSYYG